MLVLRWLALLGCLLSCWSCDGGPSQTDGDARTADADDGGSGVDAGDGRRDAGRGDADASPPGDADDDFSDGSAGGPDTGAPSNRDGGAQDASADAGPPAEGFFIAVSGGAKIVRSQDGSSWSVASDTFSGTAGWDGFDTENLFRAACAGRLPSGQPLVLAVGGGTASSSAGSAISDFPGRIARSSDGERWTHTNSVDGAAPAVLLPTNWLGGCGFGNGRVVVAGAYFTLTSTDGASWTKHSISGLEGGADFNARNMTFGAGVFVAVGEPGIYASNDGVDWDVVSTTHANRVFFHGGVFIAPFENEAQYQRSTNGRTWTTHTAPATINRVAHDGQRFIASSRDGALLTSDDGTQFTRRNNRDDQGLMGIAYGKNTYVSLSGMTTALYFRGNVALAPLSWQSATLPGDAEGLHDLSVLFASFD
jgi:hypothetical protein